MCIKGIATYVISCTVYVHTGKEYDTRILPIIMTSLSNCTNNLITFRNDVRITYQCVWPGFL